MKKRQEDIASGWVARRSMSCIALNKNAEAFLNKEKLPVAGSLYVCIVSILCIFVVGLYRYMISLYPR